MENEKTPEQLQAEALEAKKQKAGELHFVREDRVFSVQFPKVFIPGLGERSALEICTDEEAQAYLVEQNAIGTVILEVE